MIRASFSADWLRGQNNRGYLSSPIPQPRDEEITDLVRNWEVVFDEAAAFLSQKVADSLRAFLRRDDQDKSLEVMDYIVTSDDQGFRYKRTW